VVRLQCLSMRGLGLGLGFAFFLHSTMYVGHYVKSAGGDQKALLPVHISAMSLNDLEDFESES